MIHRALNRLLIVSFLLGASRLALAEEHLRAPPSIESICEMSPQAEVTGNVSPNLKCLDGACRSAAQTLCQQSTNKQLPAADAPTSLATLSWQGMLVTSLGEKLADRTKAEVEAWFEDLLREELCKLKTKTSALWFPETCRLIKDRTGAGQQLATTMLADAMRKDLPNLVTLAVGHLQLDRVMDPVAIATLAVATDTLVAFHQIAQRSSPLFRLRDLAASAWIRQLCVTRPEAKGMTPACAVVFAGMAVDYYGSIILQASNGSVDLEMAKVLMRKVLAAGEFHCAVIRAMTAKVCTDTSAVVPEEIATFFQVADGTNPALIDELFAVFQDMIDLDALVRKLSSDPSEANAKALLVELDELLAHFEKLLWPDVSPPKHVQAIRMFLRAALELEHRDYAEAALALTAAVNLMDASLPKWVERFLPLLVDLAEAKDSGEVAAALDRAIAPIGSWRLKRQKPLWSISALVGGAFGYEVPRDGEAPGGQAFEGGWAGGLMAPIGLEYSWPVAKAWSAGLLLSVLDVGQVTWSRLEEQKQDEEEAGAETVPDTSLSQVFSPGLYLVFGAGNTPFTFGIGGSYAPGLRAYTFSVDDVGAERDISVLRFGAFLAVDVTLLPF